MSLEQLTELIAHRMVELNARLIDFDNMFMHFVHESIIHNVGEERYGVNESLSVDAITDKIDFVIKKIKNENL